MWRNETVMLMFEVLVRVVVVTAIFTGLGALVLFGMRIYIDSL